MQTAAIAARESLAQKKAAEASSHLQINPTALNPRYLRGAPNRPPLEKPCYLHGAFDGGRGGDAGGVVGSHIVYLWRKSGVRLLRHTEPEGSTTAMERPCNSRLLADSSGSPPFPIAVIPQKCCIVARVTFCPLSGNWPTGSSRP